MLEVIKSAELALKRPINYKFIGRRAGDSFALVTSNEKAKEVLGWNPNTSLVEILIDAQTELESNN